MPIPKEWVKRHLRDAKGATMFGVTLEDLTKEELIACVYAGFKAETEARKEGMRRMKFVIEGYRG